MESSKLPGCVWRGDEGDGSSFHCFHQSVSKTVCPSDCAVCSLRSESHVPIESVPEKTSLVEKISHGIVGLTKATIGIDYPGDDVVKQRWDICKSCEFFKLWQCTRCGCVASLKIRVASESCPEKKWLANGGFPV